MRRIAAAAVAIPYVAILYLASLIRRVLPDNVRVAGSGQLLVVGAAVGVIVTGMLIGLPNQAAGGNASGPVQNLSPMAPQALTDSRTQSDLALDMPFQVHFTKPMNEVSVQDALSISPATRVKFQWDATARVLSLQPDPHWQPYTHYEVYIRGTATDQQGLGLASEIHATFQSGSLTSAAIVATQVTNGLASPSTAFQITFTRPVKLITVELRFEVRAVPICPPVNGKIPAIVDGSCPLVGGKSPALVCPVMGGSTRPLVVGNCPMEEIGVVGDDPTDVASQVFTVTPKQQLASASDYEIGMDVGDGPDAATDAAGAPLQAVDTLKIKTMTAPTIEAFRPQNGGTTRDTRQPISVRFSVPMDRKSTAAALSVTVKLPGTSAWRAVAETISWADGDRVIVLTPKTQFRIGSTVNVKVSSAARAAGGLHIGAPGNVTWTVSRVTSTAISYVGKTIKSSPWYGSEVYYMALMNCTRKGGWVTRSGACSSQTHHTLPAQGALSLHAGISAVARWFAQYMAERGILNHYAYGNPHSRLCGAGYCSSSWGENIASPSSVGAAGMIDVEIFYQNEYWCRCEHYYNIMNPWFHQAGVGVWVARGYVRVVIDFYG